MCMRFGILGPIEVVARGVSVSVAQPRHRALLAYLLLQANRVVTPSEVMEALWGGAEPQSARTQLHVAISVLRRALRAQGLDEVVVTRPGGYLLVLAGDDLDATVFDRQITAAELRSSAAIGATRPSCCVRGWRCGAARRWRRSRHRTPMPPGTACTRNS